MENASDVIESTVSSAEWEEMLQINTQLYGQPRERTSSEVVFLASDAGFELRMMRAAEENLVDSGEPQYDIVKGPNGHANARARYNHLLRILPNSSALQTPFKIGPAGREDTTIGFIEYTSRQSLKASQLLCVIHNPNW
ncbi:hypothetical protein [Hymenobacter wooponensis]|uniref:Uncharacterized protein n=1 Tax=Hymenobacter wooponensis TaxID=1525360 RepID=A0A4Z0MSX7_9BACT|nr:hypothetical protein [Hymenobacter wooponensis]TGD82438.1 hypothetical protein EU557_01215 [Hymenobacter wooponensis]